MSLCHFLLTFPTLRAAEAEEKLITQRECGQVAAASTRQAEAALPPQRAVVHGEDRSDDVSSEGQAANQLLKRCPGGHTGTVLGPEDQSVRF